MFGLKKHSNAPVMDRGVALAAAHEAAMRGDEDAAWAALESAGLSMDDLWAYGESLDVSPGDGDTDFGPGIVLPPDADPTRDWAKILTRCGQPARVDLRGDRWVVTPLEETTLTLAPGTKPTDGERVDAFVTKQGSTLLSFNPFMGEATVASLDPETVRVRRYLAGVLNMRPWETSVTLCRHDSRIEAVVVDSVPPLSGAEKRQAVMTEAVLGLPGGSNGWKIIDQPQAQRMILRYGEPAALPDRVLLADLLPATMEPTQWATLPIGLGTDGLPVALNLKAGVHTAAVGPTGSGKSIATNAVIGQALCRGFEVIVIETAKWGLDFKSISPWITAMPTREDGWPGVQALIERIYAELERRRSVLELMGEVNTADLSQAVCDAERIHPWLVVVDEFAAFSQMESVPKTLEKDHPLVVQAREINTAKEVGLAYLMKLAAEARYVQIHLLISTQRPDAGSVIPSTMRSNLTGGLQLSAPGKPPARETIGMIMPGEMASEAEAVLRALDDGHSKGLAVTSVEGGSVSGLRVAFADTKMLAELLTERGIPEATPLPRLAGGPEPEPDKRPVDFSTIDWTTPEDEPEATVPALSLDDLSEEVEDVDTSKIVIEGTGNLWD